MLTSVIAKVILGISMPTAPSSEQLERLCNNFGLPVIAEPSDPTQAWLRQRVIAEGHDTLELHAANPSPESALQLGALGSRLCMWHAVDQFQSGERALPTLTPREYQEGELGKLVIASTMLEAARSRPNASITERITRRLGAAMATGWGKTMAGLYLAHALGIANRSLPDDCRPRLLIASSRSRVLHEMFRDPSKGIGKFLPHASKVQYVDVRASQRDSLGVFDIVGVSYSHLSRMTPEEITRLFATVSMVWFDEAHNLLGPVVSGQFDELTRGTLTLLTTATPNRNTISLEAKVKDWPVVVPISEALREGMVRPAEMWMVESGVTFTPEGNGEGDYTYRTLKELANNNTRNQLITTLASDLAADGTPTIISCIPGKDSDGTSCAHAELLANSLNSIDIEVTGNDGIKIRRKIVARVIKSDDPNSKRYIEEFEAGTVDVILTVDMLGEGFDSQRVGAVIHARPHLSEWKLEQEIGRGFHRRDGIFISIQIVDRIDYGLTRNLPATTFAIVGLDRVHPGVVVGRLPASSYAYQPSNASKCGAGGKQKSAAGHPKPTDTHEVRQGRMSPVNAGTPPNDSGTRQRLVELTRSSSINNLTVSVAFVGNSLERVHAAPDGWKPVDTFATKRFSTESCIRMVLSEASRRRTVVMPPVILVDAAGNKTVLVCQASQKLLRSAHKLPQRKPTDLLVTTLVRKSGIPRDELYRLASEQMVWRLSGHTQVLVIPQSAWDKLLPAIRSRPPTITILSAVALVNDELVARNGPHARKISAAQIKYLLNHMRWPSVPVPPQGQQPTSVDSGVRKTHDSLEAWQVRAIVEAFDADGSVPEGNVTLSEISDLIYNTNGPLVSVKDLVNFCADAGIAHELRYTGANKGQIHVPKAIFRRVVNNPGLFEAYGWKPRAKKLDELLAEPEQMPQEPGVAGSVRPRPATPHTAPKPADGDVPGQRPRQSQDGGHMPGQIEAPTPNSAAAQLLSQLIENGVTVAQLRPRTSQSYKTVEEVTTIFANRGAADPSQTTIDFLGWVIRRRIFASLDFPVCGTIDLNGERVVKIHLGAVVKYIQEQLTRKA